MARGRAFLDIGSAGNMTTFTVWRGGLLSLVLSLILGLVRFSVNPTAPPATPFHAPCPPPPDCRRRSDTRNFPSSGAVLRHGRGEQVSKCLHYCRRQDSVSRWKLGNSCCRQMVKGQPQQHGKDTKS